MGPHIYASRMVAYLVIITGHPTPTIAHIEAHRLHILAMQRDAHFHF